jgi:hypothetical protein
MGLSLFENSREINLNSAVMMVEDVLIALGHFVNDCRVEDPQALRAWRVAKGSAHIAIQVVERPDHPHLRVISAVMRLAPGSDPSLRADLHADLLARNADLAGVAFAARGDQVLLVAERTTLDLDRSEVHDLIRRVSEQADAVDNALVASYGGTIGGTP